ncbi:MAG: hypothetical protein V7636_230 [Actinomycetota bacterium]
MCTYVTKRVEVEGSALIDGEWRRADRAVVYFDHPQDAPVAHALCIDVWSDDGRVAVELDGESARRLATAILGILDSREVADYLTSA